MRSYYEHLGTAASSQQVVKAIPQKPIFRASAIFPVMQFAGVSTRIIFMGYWILKRNIQQIGYVASLRSEKGDLLNRVTSLITEAKTYRLELSDLLGNLDHDPSEPFFGSMEVEFFSTTNLFFPYPAVAINYYGPQFSSAVHVAQRVYNNFEDLRNNTQTQVPESGFNIYADEDHEPVIGLINGPEPTLNNRVEIEFFNLKEETFRHQFELGDLAPYQTTFIYPARHTANLAKFLNGEVGTAKVHFKANWIFPRLLVGNINHALPAVSITHSYYDCSLAKSESDYWLEPKPEWYPASLMIPINIAEDSFTNIYFYPIYSPTHFTIDIEIYDDQGKLLGTKCGAIQITSPSLEKYIQIDFKKLCAELQIVPQKDLAARVIARSSGDSRIPARIKIALDKGYLKQKKTPCNICMNLQPFNPSWETKPSSFKWAPLLADQPHSSLWIMNSSPEVHYLKSAEIILTFYHEKDVMTLSRKLVLPAQGFCVIRAENDPELWRFFEGQIGWCTVVSTNPYTTTYYFSDNSSGAVGGDHGF